jgi:heat shock protein HslJ
MKTSGLMAAIAAALLIPTLAACSSDSTSTSTTSPAASEAPVAGNGTAPLPTGGAELANTRWTLSGASYDTAVTEASGITLDFAEADASGNGGVNTYNASYTSAADGSLTFGPIASTKMAGEQAAMDAEATYLEALQSVTGYSVNSEGLLDLFAGPDQILTFVTGG